MVSRRLFCNLRLKLKSQVIIFLLLIVFISLALLYRALMSHNSSRSSMFPTMEKRPVRFQPKYIPNMPHPQQVIISRDGALAPRPRHNPFQNSNEFISLKDRDLLNANSREAVSKFLATLYPVNWRTALETDEVAYELKYILTDYGFESKMSCKEIDQIRLGNPISFSRSKYIEYGYPDGAGGDDYNSYYDRGYNNDGRFNNDRGLYNRGGNNKKTPSNMAVKSPSSDQDTKIACMKQVYDAELCATMGNYRFLREVLFLSTMHHPGILTMKGYCLRGSAITSRLQSKGLILVTDIGSPVTTSHVHMASRTQKLSMALQISQLLLYLESSPLGSLRLTKVQMKDFVLVKETVVKLADYDDLELGEKSCSVDEDCVIQDSGKMVECSSSACEGFNALSNLDMVAKAILLPLLHPPFSTEDTALVEKLQKTEITTADVEAALQKLYSDAPPDHPPARNGDSFNQRRQDVKFMAVDRPSDNRILPVPKEPSLIIDDILTRYLRHNGRNFVGLYDYPCPGSRVSWGCVFTVTSLKQAANLCFKDLMCKSFVVFTTLPESETLMTVVLKNNTDSNPSTSSGTTLFIKIHTAVPQGGQEVGVDNDAPLIDNRPQSVNRLVKENDGVRDSRMLDNAEDEDEDEDEEVDEKEGDVFDEIQECLDQTLQNYEAARYSREKRLMAHLGLKGTREQSWRISAFNQDLGSFSLIVRAEGGGGKVLTELVKRRKEDKDQVAVEGTFMAEDGPLVYHAAHAWVYHMDRILGFYHTPPCVGKTLSSIAVEKLHTSFSWEETFRPLIESDGTLTGILMSPMPKIMSLSRLTLTPLPEMTSTVTPFTRPQKLQLEYVLLWWLGGMNMADNDHLGYKGHLIHFHADKGFVNTTVNLSEYLNHCQFPNVAYKSLMCFRCRKGAIGTSICNFGEEAANRVQAMFEDEVEMDLHQHSESTLTSFINQAASTIVLKVDSCIRKFGRENVLY